MVERRSAKDCTEDIDEVKIAEITSAGHENVCVCSYTIYVVLTVMILTISIGIGAYFAYSRLYVLRLAHVLNEIALKQQFNENNSIECNSVELINGKSQTNRYQKLNLLFLLRYN